ncbi:SDR family NAD(P)-dependent oxidoreductase [Tianweitania sediminis]|uniref:SDR family oxidoreductase n=1 Tax=Tianweitania sediminis TaxID=1502156 RepID=A0A8J7UMH0_9HYPH|nr:SDR family oxidoreductase [Tianweitania sediminis]MBP0440347.1 SDR family oxidoreductase [Tianweitania sediminis]
MLEMFSLKGKVAIVTGASGALGREVARGLAGAGAEVVLVGRNLTALETLKADIETANGKARTLQLDLTDEAAVVAAIGQVVQDCGQINILANIAGIIEWKPLEQSTEADLTRVLDTNLRATFVISRECSKAMIERGQGGRIITTSSVLGPLGRANLHAYSASKSGLIGLTRAMAAELGKSGITANCVAPGYFETEMTAPLRDKPDFAAAIEGVTPLERWGRAEEIVGAFIFLASQASSYVTGQVLYVDGGLTASFKFQLAA